MLENVTDQKAIPWGRRPDCSAYSTWLLSKFPLCFCIKFNWTLKLTWEEAKEWSLRTRASDIRNLLQSRIDRNDTDRAWRWTAEQKRDHEMNCHIHRSLFSSLVGAGRWSLYVWILITRSTTVQDNWLQISMLNITEWQIQYGWFLLRLTRMAVEPLPAREEMEPPMLSGAWWGGATQSGKWLSSSSECLLCLSLNAVAILLLDIHAKEIKARVHTNTCIYIYSNLIQRSPKVETTQMPTSRVRNVYVYTAGLFTHRKREITSSDGMWVDLDNKPLVRLHCVKCPG